jgi:hypothetical protein
LLAALGPLFVVPSCNAEGGCTELDCDHESVVTFPPGLVSGAYDLVISAGGRTLGARCLDPSAPETADNPTGLTCDAEGYELLGDALANERSVSVTIIDVDTEEVLADTVEVILNAVGEDQPNGPGCPPTCFVRNGRLTVP